MFTTLSFFLRHSFIERVVCTSILSLLITVSITAQSATSEVSPVAPEEPISACQATVPVGQYILAESFFKNFDYVVRRVAMLQTYGFKDASYVHTSCQAFDVNKDLYIVIISKPTATKAELYEATRAAYRLALQQEIRLINTRIVEALR